MKAKIRKGDQVMVISGRFEDKGKKGEVIKVLPDEQRIVVQSVNMRTKHQSQVQSQGRTVTPGKVRFEAPFHISNVMLVCPRCNAQARTSRKMLETGFRVRVCRKCNEVVETQ